MEGASNMSERSNLLSSVADTIKTYRSQDLPTPTVQHVDRWLNQFTPARQLDFIREFDHVIKQTYLREEFVASFLGGLLTNKELAGVDPKKYWRQAHLLNIQEDGDSQRDMLKLFDGQLRAKFGIPLSACGVPGGEFLYVDDVVFTGGRISTDLGKWIKEKAPKTAALHVIVVARHTLGQYFLEKNLREAVTESGKSITIRYWCTKFIVENRRARKNNSGVLWPTTVPAMADVQKYVEGEGKFPFEPRAPGGALGCFSSEAGRSILEQEFLIAGVKIRALSQNPKSVNRPLGHSNFGIGFGSTIVSYRNCPNNCPLALWWGDPTVTSGPFHWYPLVQRNGYG
jgi:hypothetical protein